MIEVETFHVGNMNVQGNSNPSGLTNFQDASSIFSLHTSEDEVWIPKDQTIHWGKRPNVSYPTVTISSGLKGALPSCLSNIPRGSKLCARLCSCDWIFQDLDDKDSKEKISDDEIDSVNIYNNDKIDPKTFCCLGEDKSIVPFEKGAAIFRHLRVSKEIKLKLAETVFITNLCFEIGFSSPFTMNSFHPVMTNLGGLIIKKNVRIHIVANKKSFKVLEKRIGNSILTSIPTPMCSTPATPAVVLHGDVVSSAPVSTSNNSPPPLTHIQVMPTERAGPIQSHTISSLLSSSSNATHASNVSVGGSFRAPSPFSLSLGMCPSPSTASSPWVMNDTECMFDELSCDAGSLFASVNTMILNNHGTFNQPSNHFPTHNINNHNHLNIQNGEISVSANPVIKRDITSMKKSHSNSTLSIEYDKHDGKNEEHRVEEKAPKRIKLSQSTQRLLDEKNDHSNHSSNNQVPRQIQHNFGAHFTVSSGQMNGEPLHEILSELNVMQKWLDSFRTKVIDYFQNRSNIPPYISFSNGIDKSSMRVEENNRIIVSKKVFDGSVVEKNRLIFQFLFTAVRTHDIAFLISLIQNFQFDINSKNDKGNTLLQASSIHGFIEGVEWLLRMGADVNVSNTRGMTPLHLAYMRNDQTLKDLLESHNANPDLYNAYGQKPKDIQTRRKPLRRGKEHVAMVDIVLEDLSGARFPIQIWCAARFGWLDIVKLYIENYFYNVDARNSNGCTPLMIACDHGHEDIVKYLLSLGSDPNARDIFDRCPLHYAYMGNSVHLIPILEVQYQADKDVRDIWNRTPIFYHNILHNNNNSANKSNFHPRVQLATD